MSQSDVADRISLFELCGNVRETILDQNMNSTEALIRRRKSI